MANKSILDHATDLDTKSDDKEENTKSKDLIELKKEKVKKGIIKNNHLLSHFLFAQDVDSIYGPIVVVDKKYSI